MQQQSSAHCKKQSVKKPRGKGGEKWPKISPKTGNSLSSLHLVTGQQPGALSYFQPGFPVWFILSLSLEWELMELLINMTTGRNIQSPYCFCQTTSGNWRKHICKCLINSKSQENTPTCLGYLFPGSATSKGVLWGRCHTSNQIEFKNWTQEGPKL